MTNNRSHLSKISEKSSNIFFAGETGMSDIGFSMFIIRAGMSNTVCRCPSSKNICLTSEL